MRKLLIWVVAVLLGPASLAATNAAADRVILFLTNSYTGTQMEPRDWLTEKAASAELFAAFGGLDALVRQSTSGAQSYGGLKSVQILDVKQEGNAYVVIAEVHF